MRMTFARGVAPADSIVRTILRWQGVGAER
jgi:hypothetical protein